MATSSYFMPGDRSAGPPRQGPLYLDNPRLDYGAGGGSPSLAMINHMHQARFERDSVGRQFADHHPRGDQFYHAPAPAHDDYACRYYVSARNGEVPRQLVEQATAYYRPSFGSSPAERCGHDVPEPYVLPAWFREPANSAAGAAARHCPDEHQTFYPPSSVDYSTAKSKSGCSSPPRGPRVARSGAVDSTGAPFVPPPANERCSAGDRSCDTRGLTRDRDSPAPTNGVETVSGRFGRKTADSGTVGAAAETAATTGAASAPIVLYPWMRKMHAGTRTGGG